MNLIIDGYNLLYRVETKKTKLEDKREELIGLLAEFSAVNDTNITLVFDGRNQESLHRGYEKRGDMKIMFSAKGETADDVIMDMISKRTKKARTYLIITSDNRIRDFAHNHHMKSETSEEFVEYLL